ETGELVSIVTAAGGWIATAYNGDLRQVQAGRVAQHIQQGWRAADFPQQCRVVSIIHTDHSYFGMLTQPSEITDYQAPQLARFSVLLVILQSLHCRWFKESGETGRSLAEDIPRHAKRIAQTPVTGGAAIWKALKKKVSVKGIAHKHPC